MYGVDNILQHLITKLLALYMPSPSPPPLTEEYKLSEAKPCDKISLQSKIDNIEKETNVSKPIIATKTNSKQPEKLKMSQCSEDKKVDTNSIEIFNNDNSQTRNCKKNRLNF